MRAALRGDPTSVRRALLERLCDVTQSAAACWYAMGIVSGAPVPVRWMVVGVDEVFVSPRAEAGIGWPHADPRLPNPRWDRAFVPLGSVLDVERELWPSALYARCHAPAGVHDLVRMLVYDGGELIAWIGALRTRGEPPFGRVEQRRLAPLAQAFADTLVMAEREERALSSHDEGGELVVALDGRVELASAAGERMLARAHARAAIERWARQLAPGRGGSAFLLGQRATWLRLEGGGAARYLLRFHPVLPVRRHPAYVLSPMQREIAMLAASGASAPEIAGMLRMSSATARTHLRQVYQRLGVACRAELAGALEGMLSWCAELAVHARHPEREHRSIARLPARTA